MDKCSVFARFFDRRIIRRCIQNLPFEEAVWRNDANKRESFATIMGDGFRVVIMPIRMYDDDATARALPSFPSAGAL